MFNAPALRMKDNKSYIKYFFMVTLFVAVLLSFRLLWSVMFSTPEHPTVVKGVLDMRGWNFETSHTISLNGEWEFYPSAFISHEASTSRSAEAPHYLQVPGDWRSAFPEGTDTSYGYGTYRLRILVDAGLKQPYTVWIQDIQASSVVEINGQKQKEFGHPAENRQNYKPYNVSYTASYEANGAEEIELLIRAANFEHPFFGGIAKSIRFGSQAAVDFERWYSIGFQLVTFVVLLLHGLYACILYLFHPRQKALLLFFLLLLVAAITVVSDNDKILQIWFPINYMWILKIRLFAYMGVSFFILYLTKMLYGKPDNRRLFHFYTILLVLYSIFTLFASPPLIYYSRKAMLFGFLYFFPMLWFVYLAIKMVLRRQSDSIYLLLAIISIASSILWGAFNFSEKVSNVFFPVDMIAAIIAFSSYWFKQYFRNAEENARLNKQLREADRLKDQFLANTSHELRTPLHGILNISQSLMNRQQHTLDNKSMEDLQLLVMISTRMSHMVEDLMDVARLQEKRIVLKKEPLAVRSIVTGVFGMLAFMTESKPVQLEMKIPETIPPVLADEKRLTQILFNLVHNALKYTMQGTVAVSARSENGQVVIEVSDTGYGMDAETQARIFSRYEQGFHGGSNSSGIGLGLSICKELVELHGGDITVRSTPGEGSVFSFTLPMLDLQEIPASNLVACGIDTPPRLLPESVVGPYPYPSIEVESVPFEEGRANILAVDDDPVNLKVLAGILGTEPYNLKLVSSADEALSLLGTEQWDLIIADVMMPEMSGYDLTRLVRERFSVSELPVLLLTARNEPADIYAGFKSGANDYVAKPVDALELKYRIRSLIALKQSVHEHLRMEAAYLQAQIQPHFLFNTLNSIMALSDLDTERMRKLGDAFIEYLRISFHFLNTGSLVPLSHELKLVRTYLYIEKERFGDRLSILWEGNADETLLLPPLSIQPLVENAVRHGIQSRARGGTIRIRIDRKGDCILIEVQDDGKGMKADDIRMALDPTKKKEWGGIGLTNTNRRLKQMYGSGLMIQSLADQGTTVSFEIPVTSL
ncbi:ATP-binding protein [Paenibacillus sp. OAS669]|uniref:ATP-binding protein n=1 Tax=Paenibacillus sp. OAS669 TaxID=2663821 RepID=UPI0019F7AA9D|nr:ATP-binding protein [Paenibacillus sp. OAS669]MBE1442410.1 sensor histidine kinase YesM [Paenibacillus sp. OAS669]